MIAALKVELQMIGFGIPHGMELLIVLAVVLLLFGHRLPGMARSLGSGITEFKRGLKDGAKSKGGSSDGTGDGSSDGDAKDSSIGSSKDDSDSSGSGSAR